MTTLQKLGVQQICSCGLFYDAVSIQTTQRRMDLEGRGSGLIEILSLHLPAKTEENHMKSQPGEGISRPVRTEHPLIRIPSAAATPAHSLYNRCKVKYRLQSNLAKTLQQMVNPLILPQYTNVCYRCKHAAQFKLSRYISRETQERVGPRDKRKSR
jgi:hypothetical protein